MHGRRVVDDRPNKLAVCIIDACVKRYPSRFVPRRGGERSVQVGTGIEASVMIHVRG